MLTAEDIAQKAARCDGRCPGDCAIYLTYLIEIQNLIKEERDACIDLIAQIERETPGQRAGEYARMRLREAASLIRARSMETK